MRSQHKDCNSLILKHLLCCYVWTPKHDLITNSTNVVFRHAYVACQLSIGTCLLWHKVITEGLLVTTSENKWLHTRCVDTYVFKQMPFVSALTLAVREACLCVRAFSFVIWSCPSVVFVLLASIFISNGCPMCHCYFNNYCRLVMHPWFVFCLRFGTLLYCSVVHGLHCDYGLSLLISRQTTLQYLYRDIIVFSQHYDGFMKLIITVR